MFSGQRVPRDFEASVYFVNSDQSSQIFTNKMAFINITIRIHICNCQGRSAVQDSVKSEFSQNDPLNVLLKILMKSTYG